MSKIFYNHFYLKIISLVNNHYIYHLLLDILIRISLLSIFFTGKLVYSKIEYEHGVKSDYYPFYTLLCKQEHIYLLKKIN